MGQKTDREPVRAGGVSAQTVGKPNTERRRKGRRAGWKCARLTTGWGTLNQSQPSTKVPEDELALESLLLSVLAGK